MELLTAIEEPLPMFGTQPHEPLPKINVKTKKKETIGEKLKLG